MHFPQPSPAIEQFTDSDYRPLPRLRPGRVTGQHDLFELLDAVAFGDYANRNDSQDGEGASSNTAPLSHFETISPLRPPATSPFPSWEILP